MTQRARVLHLPSYLSSTSGNLPNNSQKATAQALIGQLSVLCRCAEAYCRHELRGGIPELPGQTYHRDCSQYQARQSKTSKVIMPQKVYLSSLGAIARCSGFAGYLAQHAQPSVRLPVSLGSSSTEAAKQAMAPGSVFCMAGA